MSHFFTRPQPIFDTEGAITLQYALSCKRQEIVYLYYDGTETKEGDRLKYRPLLDGISAHAHVCKQGLLLAKERNGWWSKLIDMHKTTLLEGTNVWSYICSFFKKNEQVLYKKEKKYFKQKYTLMEQLFIEYCKEGALISLHTKEDLAVDPGLEHYRPISSFWYTVYEIPYGKGIQFQRVPFQTVPEHHQTERWAAYILDINEIIFVNLKNICTFTFTTSFLLVLIYYTVQKKFFKK